MMKSPLKFLETTLCVCLLCLFHNTAFSQPSDLPEKDQYQPKNQYFKPLAPAEIKAYCAAVKRRLHNAER